MITVEAILPHLRPLVSIRASTTLADACTRMELDDVSRLPVFRGKEQKGFQGMLRRQDLFLNMLRDSNFDRSMTVMEFVDGPDSRTGIVNKDTSLFEIMGQLDDMEEILVLDDENSHIGLITAKGIMRWWSIYARPFLVIEHLERTLRDSVAVLSSAQLEEACKVDSVEKLSPSSYQRLYQEYWEILPLQGLNKGDVCKRLQGFAEFRNKLMHFRLHDEVDLKEVLRTLASLEGAVRARTKPEECAPRICTGR